MEHTPAVDTVRLYLDDIGRRQLLDRDDEERLGRAVQAGLRAERLLAEGRCTDPGERRALAAEVTEGARAARQFVEANLRLVVSVARRYRSPGSELLDLVQAGNVGLLRAVRGFDWQLGNRFSTYATWWIRQAIVREMGDAGRAIRLPARQRQQVFEMARARDRLRVELGHEPSLTEIGADLGAAEDRVRELVLMAENVVSLSRPVGDHDDTQLADFLADPGTPDPADAVAGKAEQKEVRVLLDHLGDHQAAVLRLRFGLDGCEPRSLQQVGRELGISRERARQIEARALRSLRGDELARTLREAS